MKILAIFFLPKVNPQYLRYDFVSQKHLLHNGNQIQRLSLYRRFIKVRTAGCNKRKICRISSVSVVIFFR